MQAIVDWLRQEGGYGYRRGIRQEPERHISRREPLTRVELLCEGDDGFHAVANFNGLDARRRCIVHECPELTQVRLCSSRASNPEGFAQIQLVIVVLVDHAPNEVITLWQWSQREVPT